MIVKKPRGIDGFGYDPIFIPNKQKLTFAQISKTKKIELTRNLINDNFENDFKSNLSKLSADSFLHCLTRYEKIQNISGRIMSFAGLRYYQSTTDAARTKFLSDMQEKITI